ncbi:MAG TPA: hypothetical protein VGG56_00670 [Terracidiphilus sp.]|jgi:hypothetical protein
MWIPRRIELAIEAIASHLGEIKKSLNENKSAIDATNIRQDDAWSGVGRQIAKMSPDDEYKRGANTYKHKGYRQQVVLNILTGFLMAATIGAFAAAGIYACIANRQLKKMDETYKEIQKQTTLMQNQTIGTKGAVLQFVPSLNVLANREDGPAFSSTVRAWSGRVTARHIVLTVRVQRITLPNKAPIGSPVRCDINAPQLASFETGMNEIAQVCELPGFGTKAADEVMFTRQSVTISGSLVYENGFDQTITQNICQTYIGYRYKSEVKGPNGNTNLVSGEDESFHDCGDFDRILSRAMRFKNRYQENYIPNRP